MGKLSDYAEVGDSVSLAKLDGKPFTIVKIEDSDYTQGEETTKGVKVTTKETFEIDGNEQQKFHSTRVAIVKKLAGESIRKAVNENGVEIGPVKCESQKSSSGKSFYALVDVEPEGLKATL